MSVVAQLARFGCLTFALAFLASCGKPDLDSAQKAISKYDAMSPEAVLCNKNELGQFRSAVHRYAKANQANGEMWPDFSYKNMHPDDMTVTALAGVYVKLLSPRDLGNASWHLGELQPDWTSFGAYADSNDGWARPSTAMLKQGAKYACSDLVKYGYALAEHELSERYWRERFVKEGYLSNRRWEQKQALAERATKRMASDLRHIMRLERDLVDAIDSAQMAQR